MTRTSTTHTWRDLKDRLTTEQAAEMLLFEREVTRYSGPPGQQPTDVLHRIAAGMVKSNQAQARFAHIAVPADAIDTPSPWEELDGELLERVYRCWQHPAAPEAVQVIGYQRSDGTTTRAIVADVDLEDIDAGTSRAIAAALIEAADVIDRLNGTGQ